MASVAFHFFNQYRTHGKVKLFEGSGGYGAGEQRRDFVSVEDVVAVNLHFLEHPNRSGIVNVGTGSAQTFNEVAVATVNACRRAYGEAPLALEQMQKVGRDRIRFFPRRSRRGRYQSFTEADLGNLRRSGYGEPLLRVESGVARYVSWMLERSSPESPERGESPMNDAKAMAAAVESGNASTDKHLEDFVGNTPLVRLKRMPGATSNALLAKLEGNNPAGSVKDRPALSMITRAQERGDIKPGDTLIEATSGNTGIALAMAAAMMGYRMILIMPEHLSIERRQTMAAFGAEIVLVTKEQGMEGARDVADRMVADGMGVMLDQFANPDNPLAHYEGTGPEIWRDTGGRVTHFVATMGTTGTIMGVSRFLKEKDPSIQIIGVHPAEGLAGAGHPQVAESLSAEDLRRAPRRSHNRGDPGRRGGNGAAAGARGRHFRRHFLRRRAVGGARGVVARFGTR